MIKILNIKDKKFFMIIKFKLNFSCKYSIFT